MPSDPRALPDFEAPDLAAVVESLPQEAVDSLPFGTIRVGIDGAVQHFSQAEQRLSGYSRKAVGLDFYSSVAPCMNNADFRGRIEAAAKAGKLDIEFGHTGDFSDKERELRVRVMSASNGGYWIFLAREE